MTINDSNLFSDTDSLVGNFIEPLKEIAAYEILWTKYKSVKQISELFSKSPGSKPTDHINLYEHEVIYDYINSELLKKNLDYSINILLNNTMDYPSKLKDARYPVELLYYSGNLERIYDDSIAIVGTRNPTPEGIRRADKLSRMLVKDNYTIVSGLARGIDTVALSSAIRNGGKTIAVIGTPLTKYYPKENRELQNYIANNHLLISQVPFYRHSKQGVFGNRLFFPERNKTMSAISKATIIVEAGETSGTLIQARAALYQKRKLFILDSCFNNPKISWPAKFLDKGAIRVREYSDIINNLADEIDQN